MNFKTYRDTNGSISIVEQGSDANSEILQNNSIIEERVMPTTIIPCSGRLYLYSDRRWVTDSDDLYGPNYYQMTESGGTGSVPIAEWEHLGTVIPAGRKMHKLHFVCRANNPQVTDLDMRIIMRTPSPITRWETGLDNDAEDAETLLFSGTFTESGWSGNMQDLRKKEIDLGDVAVSDTSFVSIYIRGVGNLTGTRYLYSSWSWEII